MGGVGRRLKQAAEAASVDAQARRGHSIQDRLKRYPTSAMYRFCVSNAYADTLRFLLLKL